MADRAREEVSANNLNTDQNMNFRVNKNVTSPNTVPVAKPLLA